MVTDAQGQSAIAQTIPMTNRLAFVWDYDIDEAQFQAMLAGELEIGRIDGSASNLPGSSELPGR